jgi:diguanylate cyclase (GGDEF)-like protein/PAS domain S-box-containing protein
MRSNKSLTLLNYLASIIAALVFIVPPSVFLALDYRYEKAAIEIEAEINARIVGQLINNNPGMWVFEELRLEELLSRRSNRGNSREIRSVFGPDTKLVAQSKDLISPPFMSAVAPLFDAGKAVGRIEVVRSMRPSISGAALIALGSLLLASIIFFVLRTVPLRALRKAFEDLHEEKEKALITLRSIGDAVITTDATMHVEYLNPIAERLTGWTSAEARGLPMDQVFEIYNEQTRQRAINPIKECLETNEIVEMENHTILVRKTDKEEFHIEDSAAPILRSDGSVLGAVMVFHDVTERKAAQQRLHHVAFHDALTGLPNRSLFHKILTKSIRDAHLVDKHVAVLFMDLDRFKIINDSLGHGIGDELLVLVAKRLGQCVRDSDTVSRIGGDEFTAVLRGIISPENAGSIAAKVIEAVSKPYTVQGHELYISVSIGIAIFPNDGDDIETLLKNADTAMYCAKDRGRSNYQYYAMSMNNRAVEHLHLNNALHTALDNNEFVLEYQPKLDLRTNNIVGAEALLRWESPEFGRVMPNDFISKLEDSGAIIEVGAWVLKTAILQAKQWLDAGRPLVVSVNVSARQFRQAGLVEHIASLLQTTGLPPDLLQIEITESSLIDNADSSEFVMREIKRNGVKISLDDFGTGYSSLSYLRRFPIDELKIDRSFVMDMVAGEAASNIINAIIDLGQALGMRVIAEGVETEKQSMQLRAMDCDEIQGYLISRPLGIKVFDEFLHQNTPVISLSGLDLLTER